MGYGVLLPVAVVVLAVRHTRSGHATPRTRQVATGAAVVGLVLWVGLAAYPIVAALAALAAGVTVVVCDVIAAPDRA
ncbi:MAG: hypothetical protein U0871_29120 [Gemmataceae bacterium]